MPIWAYAHRQLNSDLSEIKVRCGGGIPRPLRNDIESQRPGSSFLGDRLKDLFDVYKLPGASVQDITAPLAAWVAQVMEHANFTGGTQQDAAECLMHILLGVDGGEMQRRVCGANAAVSAENMILLSLIHI